MMRLIGFGSTIVILLSALNFGAAKAQMTWNPPIGIWPGVMYFNNQANNAMLQSGNANSTNNESTTERPAPRLVSTTYTPSSARTRTNLAAFVAKTRRTDPVQADKMQELFASTDVIGEIGNVLVQFGLEKNNVAHAYAAYWVSSWQAANSDLTTPSKQMLSAVAAQATSRLAQNTGFAAANDAEKQEFAEVLLVLTALTDTHMQLAVGNPAQLRAVAIAAKRGAAATGLELDTMTLTEDGFQIAGDR
jgi:hypothetical protein